MAKQSVNVIERHLEKAVLGICAAVLLASIVFYLVSNPNTIDLEGEVVGPASIDERIRDAGRALRDRFQNAQPEQVEVVNHVPMLEQASSPLAFAEIPAEIPSPVPFLPRVPDIGDAPPRVGEIRLAEVIAPSTPLVTHGRSTVHLVPPTPLGVKGQPPPEGVPGFEIDVNWVTVAAQFDQQRQISVCRSAGYKVGRQNPYVVGVDLQRRERLVGGVYSDWADVKQYAPTVLSEFPPVEVVEGRKGPVVTESTRDAVTGFFNLLRESQIDLVRPMFPQVQWGDPWLYPKFADTSIPELDRELCYLVKKADTCLPRDYPPQTDQTAPVTEVPKTDLELVEEALTRAKALFDADQWTDAVTLAESIKTMPGVRTNHTQQADQIIDLSRQAIRDVAEGRRPAPAPKDETEDVIPEHRSRYQVIWAHDADSPTGAGAQSGKTYQYRIRVKLYNRYCAVPGDLAEPNDAKQVFVVGEWSPPSEDVYVRPDTEFFLSSGSTNTRSGAKVTVFKWFEGVWVSDSFSAEVGKPVGGGSRQVVRILDNGQPDRPLIDFFTGCTVVDVDYDYEFRARRRKGREGFIVDTPKPTVAMVYLDSEGVLQQRILAVDRYSDEYKEFKEMVFAPPRQR